MVLQQDAQVAPSQNLINTELTFFVQLFVLSIAAIICWETKMVGLICVHHTNYRSYPDLANLSIMVLLTA